MRCPRCDSEKLSVADSRHREGRIYRRRECRDCGYRFSTIELPIAEWDRHQREKEAIARLKEILHVPDDHTARS